MSSGCVSYETHQCLLRGSCAVQTLLDTVHMGPIEALQGAREDATVPFVDMHIIVLDRLRAGCLSSVTYSQHAHHHQTCIPLRTVTHGERSAYIQSSYTISSCPRPIHEPSCFRVAHFDFGIETCGMTAAIHHRHACGLHSWPEGVRGDCEARSSRGLAREVAVELRRRVEAGEDREAHLGRGDWDDVHSGELRRHAAPIPEDAGRGSYRALNKEHMGTYSTSGPATVSL